MLDIHWSSEGNDYSHLRVNGSWNIAATAFIFYHWKMKLMK